MPQTPSFKALGLSAEILKIVEKKGFTTPSPIQELAIPLVLAGHDVIAQAQTGTGKTAAFGLPILESVRSDKGCIQALIMVPTRELATQVAEEIESLRVDKNVQVLPIYGGQSMQDQLRRLKKGVDIVVATPGRLMDHMERRSINLSQLSFVVLDEADEMLRMGFIDDIEHILKACPVNRRTLLFSATMPKPILDITGKYMSRDKKVVSVKKDEQAPNLTEQIYYEVRRDQRFEALAQIIETEDSFYGVVFCRTKLDVDDLSKQLLGRGYAVEALHGDVSQSIRELRLKKFKARKATILVATDVAARGIDVNDLSHVVNFTLPHNAETYVHRIGRTGRAGKQGKAISFIAPSEYRGLMQISRMTKVEITKGQLPKAQDILQTKMKRIKTQIEAILTAGVKHNYVDLAKDLVGTEDAIEILAAFLQQAYPPTQAVVIEQPRFNRDSRPPSREGRPSGGRDGRPPQRDGRPPNREGRPPQRDGRPPNREARPGGDNREAHNPHAPRPKKFTRHKGPVVAADKGKKRT